MNNFMANKTLGFRVTLVTMVLSLVTALAYLAIYSSSRYMSWQAFGTMVAGVVAAALAAGWGLSELRPIGELGNLVSLQLTIVAAVLCMWFAFDGTFMAILSACVAGVAAQHIGHHISRMAVELPWIPHWSNPLEFVCVSVVYLVLYLALGRRLRNMGYYEYTDPRIAAVSVVIVLICTGITRLLRLTGYLNFFTVMATALYAITCCVLALFFEFCLYYNLRKESEHRLFRRIHEEERRQYETSRENAEMLSIKCHDLKHKLVALEGRLPQGEIDSMRSIVDTYDGIYHTGSEVLDIILNEKNLRCRGKGISITCMGSGKYLEFLDPMDVYSLFGNLLENAITAAEQLEEPQQRILSLMMQRKGNLVYIDVMNFFRGPLRLSEDGLPRTTKQEEEGYHGYRLRSVRAIARKYKGDLSVHFKDDIFTAQVYLLQEDPA